MPYGLRVGRSARTIRSRARPPSAVGKKGGAEGNGFLLPRPFAHRPAAAFGPGGTPSRRGSSDLTNLVTPGLVRRFAQLHEVFAEERNNFVGPLLPLEEERAEAVHSSPPPSRRNTGAGPTGTCVRGCGAGVGGERKTAGRDVYIREHRAIALFPAAQKFTPLPPPRAPGTVSAPKIFCVGSKERRRFDDGESRGIESGPEARTHRRSPHHPGIFLCRRIGLRRPHGAARVSARPPHGKAKHLPSLTRARAAARIPVACGNARQLRRLVPTTIALHPRDPLAITLRAAPSPRNSQNSRLRFGLPGHSGLSLHEEERPQSGAARRSLVRTSGRHLRAFSGHVPPRPPQPLSLFPSLPRRAVTFGE
jgi:hypothetical protein